MRIHGLSNVSIAVLGIGAVGGFLAAVFSKKGFAVTCIVKESNAKMLSREGIKLESKVFGEFIVKPRVVTQLDIEPDILFITTKATTLKDALKRIDKRRTENSIIIPLLNGIEHMDVLKSIFGKSVIAASIGNVELKRISKNHIVHSTATVNIKLGSNDNVKKEKLMKIADMITKSGIDTQVLENESAVLWNKLVRLNAISIVTSASNRTIGYVRNNPSWREKLIEVIKEGAAVAESEGISMDYNNIICVIDSLPETLTTSMHRDLRNKKPSEIDSISGAIVRIGKKHGIACPAIEGLINTIKSCKVYQ